MMDEYIKRKPLIEEISSLSVTLCGKELYGELAKHSVVKMIYEQPAADVVKVVRCEKCDLWNEWDAHGRRELGNYVCSCAHWSTEDGCVVYTKPNDFCSHGEPKDTGKANETVQCGDCYGECGAGHKGIVHHIIKQH